MSLYGHPIATAVLGVAGTVLGIMNMPLGAGIAVAGAVLSAVFDILGRAHQDDARQRAIEQLADAARAARGRLESGMPLGGTSVPEGTPHERLEGFARQVRERTFTFRVGRQWSDWAWLGTTLLAIRDEVLGVAALTGGHLPALEEQRVREFGHLTRRASAHASEIASAYAGYDVTEEPKRMRYAPADSDIDSTAMSAYANFSDELTETLAELDRLAALGRTDP